LATLFFTLVVDRQKSVQVGWRAGVINKQKARRPSDAVNSRRPKYDVTIQYFYLKETREYSEVYSHESNGTQIEARSAKRDYERTEIRELFGLTLNCSAGII